MDIERVKTPGSLPPRAADANKGSFGRVLIVGGCEKMSGAVALATNAALRGGAGLVEFAAPAVAHPIIAGLCPCAVSMPLECDDRGEISPAAVAQVRERFEKATVLAVGPGFDVGVVQRNIVQAALEQEKPAVIDADGLNNLAKIEDWPSMRKCPLVLTPHPGEFSRLTGISIKDIQADRETVAIRAVQGWHPQVSEASLRKLEGGTQASPPLVLVLKGAGTIVTDGRRVYVNSTGNPGMATGGTGDVLTGLLAALIAQHLEPFDATCLAVYLHGRAGDLAAQELGQPSLIATDLIDYLPMAMKEAAG